MLLPILVLIVILLAALIGWIFVNRVRPLVYGPSGPAPAPTSAPIAVASTPAAEIADPELPLLTVTEPIPDCPVCGATAFAFAQVDFNKSGWDEAEKLFPFANHPVGYAQCTSCLFTFAPAFSSWSQADFDRWIYNADYQQVDPHYAQQRPEQAAEFLTGFFGVKRASIRHLDYGARAGPLVFRLNTMGWRSTSYDPNADNQVDLNTLGRFDLITLIEVIQHVAKPHRLMQTLIEQLEPDGMILVSTSASDGHIDAGNLDWSYASPRNGHIGLYSRKSLALLAEKYQMRHYGSEGNWNMLIRGNPSWAGDPQP